MVSIYSVDPTELITKTAEELKKIDAIKPPAWASFVKTGVCKERPPSQHDWWYIRAAAVLRAVYKLGPVGVNKLRTKYGSKKGRGHKPEHFYPAGGNIIRKILQQLEKVSLIKKGEAGVFKGREIAPQGKSLLDKVAVSILKSKPKKESQKHAGKPVVEKEAEEEKEELEEETGEAEKEIEEAEEEESTREDK